MREALLGRLLLSYVKHNGYLLLGAALGLWLALCVPLQPPGGAPCPRAAPPAAPTPPATEAPPRLAPPPARAFTRPRYYSTELGMRAPLMVAVLTTLDALESRGAALNATLAPLQPNVRYFAPAPPRAPPAAPLHAPQLVAFTDPRPTLAPFHALKYLADNYLDDYHYFYIVSDDTYVNARRLQELVGGLSVSQWLYMGAPSAESATYCSLRGGALLSRSVLLAVHSALEWCVRNAYSPHHHENMGRCVLHATQVSCSSEHQGERYDSVSLSPVGALSRSHARAVSLHPVTEPPHFYQIHAYVSRMQLERALHTERALRRELAALRPRHPAGYRNLSWPQGLRTDPSLAPPAPASRWDALRWTPFNSSHALYASDHSSVTKHSAAMAHALQRVLAETGAWLSSRGALEGAGALLEGAYRCVPATGCTYRMLFAHTTHTHAQSVRQLEAVLPLGAARVVSVPYVTESARVRLVLPLSADTAMSGTQRHLLQRYIDSGSDNTELIVVLVTPWSCNSSACAAVAGALQADVSAFQSAKPQALQLLTTSASSAHADVARCALSCAARALPAHALMLLIHELDTYNDDFLNRVRMNCISGVQWFLPLPFARYALYTHPLFVDGNGKRPAQRTGRFNARHTDTLAVYNADWQRALAACGAEPALRPADVLARCGPRVLSAPEPGLLRAAPPPPPPPAPHAAAPPDFSTLDLGAPNDLAKLILQTNA